MAAFLYIGCMLLVLLPCAYPTVLKLERSLPVGMGLNDLRLRDQMRHQRIPAFNFTVFGSADLSSFGFYFARVKLGSPSQEFKLIIDTGCNLSWLSCIPCDGCDTPNKFGMHLRSYDPHSSSSSSPISCSDKICDALIDPTFSIGSNCSYSSVNCDYLIGYGDRTGASGYLISDIIHFNPVVAGSAMFSASAIFGCTNHLFGRLAKSGTAVDGLLGLGRGSISVISQLSSVGLVPPVFAHCLSGGENGGGSLVLGQIMDPGLVYSPLIQSGLFYNLNLQSIAVDGNLVDIDPAVFALKDGIGGTVVDSGTALSVLAEKAYDPFIHALTAVVSQSARPVITEGDLCFQVSSRIDDIFPLVSFNFEGGASMVVKPKDYLLWQTDLVGSGIWCIGFQKQVGQPTTILGDLVLKDKIIVYDLARQRIGWVNHNCSKSVNVSTSSDYYVNIQQRSSGSSTVKSVLASTAIFLVYISMFGY